MEMEIYQTFCDIMLEYCNVYYLLGVVCVQKGVIEGNMKMIALSDIHKCLLNQITFYKINVEDFDQMYTLSELSLFWVDGFQYYS